MAVALLNNTKQFVISITCPGRAGSKNANKHPNDGNYAEIHVIAKFLTLSLPLITYAEPILGYSLRLKEAVSRPKKD